MPGTLTIYNSGTNYDRSNSQELIASLAAKTAGDEGKDWIINPGPGSTELYNKSLRARVAGFLIGPLLGRPVVETYGAATGSGMSVNVQSTLDLVRRERPARINMAGWSRGAITCIEIANAITDAADIPGIPMSIFLVDPVPGPHVVNAWNWTEHSTKIPALVTHCSAILQEGDTRGLMMAPLVDPFRNQEDRRKSYPMPGPHSAAVEVQKPFEPVALMARFLVETFLSGRGTGLQSILRLSAAAICEQYGQMMLVLNTGEGRSSERDNVPNAYRGSFTFVNSHHREQSALAFPDTTRVFSDLSQNSISENQQQGVAAEVRRMKSDALSAWKAFGQALRQDILRTQPVPLHMLAPPLGATLSMRGAPRVVANPPALRLTRRQQFLLTLFNG